MDVKELIERFDDATKRVGFTPELVGLIGDYKIKAYRRSSKATNAPLIYISSGVHGDEPAAPLALLRLLRDNDLPRDVSFVLVPVLNPLGLEAGTRKTPEGIDINRDYGPKPSSAETKFHLNWLADQKFDLCLCLHEDSDAEGFYLYELSKGDKNPKLTPHIFDAVRPRLKIDLRSEIDGMPADGGVMNPPAESHKPTREDLPEALRLYFRHTDLCYTFETPSAVSIVDRIDAHSIAILALIKAFLSRDIHP